jgi:Protein of unknown function (DUF2905)
MSRTLILLGLILAVGLLWRWIGPLRLGCLPGDIVVEHQNFSFYFPITTGLLISAVLTLVLWLINRYAAVSITDCGRLATATHAVMLPFRGPLMAARRKSRAPNKSTRMASGSQLLLSVQARQRRAALPEQ